MLQYPQNIWDCNVQLDYEKYLENYESVFGHHNLKVRSYDAAREVGIVLDVMKSLEIDFSHALEMPDVQNIRYSWLHIEILRRANRWQLMNKVLRRQAVCSCFRAAATMFPAVFDRPHPMTESERHELMADYEASNARVSARYLNVLC